MNDLAGIAVSLCDSMGVSGERIPADLRRITPAYQRCLASEGRTILGGSGRGAAISARRYTVR